MKSWTIAAAAAALALAACSPPAQEAPAPAEQQLPVNVASGEYALDPHHTTVTIRARHFGLASYTLRFNTVSGTLNFNAENPTQSTISADVQIASLDTPYGGDRDFDAELINSEWLDGAAHPVATFRSTNVESTGPNTARVTGDLTFRGQTHPATFEVTYRGSNATHPMGFPTAMIGFSGRAVISRSQYGLNVLQPSAPSANDGVSNDVEILIEAEFTRPVEAQNQPRQPVEPTN